MTAETSAAHCAEYAARDGAHAAVIRDKRTHVCALAKEADAARLASEVAWIRSEVRLAEGQEPTKAVMRGVVAEVVSFTDR